MNDHAGSAGFSLVSLSTAILLSDVIEIRDLHKTFAGRAVLKGIDLHIRRGRTRVILGASGSGKTVLMKHIIGLLRPDRGSIRVNDAELVGLDRKTLQQVRRQFGMVFQQAALFDSMSVGDNVAFPLLEHTRMTAAEIAGRVAEKLEIVGLAGCEPMFPAELSGGMRKRVGLARALVLEPACVLYDEPTTGLDPLTTYNVDRMIIDAQHRLQMTSVVISHDVGSALRIADDIAVIDNGTIVEDCPAAEIRTSRHPHVRKFLDTWFGEA